MVLPEIRDKRFITVKQARFAAGASQDAVREIKGVSEAAAIPIHLKLTRLL